MTLTLLPVTLLPTVRTLSLCFVNFVLSCVSPEMPPEMPPEIRPSHRARVLVVLLVQDSRHCATVPCALCGVKHTP
jgi:hypothetical protein